MSSSLPRALGTTLWVIALYGCPSPASAQNSTPSPAPFSASIALGDTSDDGVEQIGKLTEHHDGLPIRLNGDQITTASSFRPPIQITIVAKTDSTNIRLGYAARQVIFNWEVDPGQLRVDGGPADGLHAPGKGAIPKNEYVTFRWVVTPDRQKIYVNDELRYEHVGDYRQIDNPISVFPGAGSIVTVKSIKTKVPKAGITMTLSKETPDRKSTSFALTFQNSSASDAIFSLGSMLGNGTVQWPSALQATVTDPSGAQRVFHWRPPAAGIAGRMDPFLVPLPAGASYQLICQPDQLLEDQTFTSLGALEPGTYQVTFNYESPPAGTHHLDAPPMNLSTGTLRSNAVSFTTGLLSELTTLAGAPSGVDIQKFMSHIPGAIEEGASPTLATYRGGQLGGEAVDRWSFERPAHGSAAATVRFVFPSGRTGDQLNCDLLSGRLRDAIAAVLGPGAPYQDRSHFQVTWNLPSKASGLPPQVILAYTWFGNDVRIALACLPGNPSFPANPPTTDAASPFPDPASLDGLGVNIHFLRGHERDLDLIQQAGVKFIRTDFSWSDTEARRGVYDWGPHEELTANLAKRGIRPIYMLGYGNLLYEPAASDNPKQALPPIHPPSMAAYVKWAGAAARHFAGRGVIWEIWNEPNGKWFWKSGPDAHAYATLAVATARAIRAADPQATIIAPASFGVDWDYLYTVFDDGLLPLIDGVSVHPYRGTEPETVGGDYAQLRSLIAVFAPAGKKRMPILDGEWGYTTTTGGISYDQQGEFLVRMLLFNMLSGIPITMWYDWIDDGPDRQNGEDNCGTVTHDYQWKPAYKDISSFMHEMAGYRLAERVPTASDQDYVLVFRDPSGHRKLVSWTSGLPHAITVDTNAIPQTALDLAALPKIWPFP